MENQNFLNTLKGYQDLLWPIIEKKIKEVNDFPSFCQLNKKYQRELDFHLKIVSDYPQRKGKYLRPALLLLTAEGMGAEREKAMTTAAAMQISEDWILNHDDIEDDSESRRGKEALHKIYGKELAINAGDALHVIMWKVLFDNFSILDKSLAMKIIEEFYTMLSRTILGQGIELKWTKEERYDLDEADNLLILESKTGYYTIAGPMRLGAIIAGASEKQLKIIYRFGIMLGRSFQIIDDLLDLTSDFSGQKKRGNDIYENKRTLMLLHLIKISSEIDKKLISKILDKNRNEKTEEDVEIIVKLMKKYSSLDYGKKMADKYAEEAKNIFDKEMDFIKIEPYRSQIKSGIDFIINRDH